MLCGLTTSRDSSVIDGLRAGSVVMRILIISPSFPYPLIDGGRKGVFYMTKSLAERGNDVHLACLTRRNDPDASARVAEHCTLHEVEAPQGSHFPGALRSLFSSASYDLSRYWNATLLAKIRGLLSTVSFDIVQAEGPHVYWYGVKIRREFNIPTVGRPSSLQHVNISRLADMTRNPFAKAFLRLEAEKVRRVEAEQGAFLDLTITISEADAEILRSQNPNIRCAVVPVGVNLDELTPGSHEPTPRTVLWMGSLGWPPNQDSFWWFYREIVPLIVARVPDVRILVAGSNPPTDIMAVRDPHVTILGFVPNVRDCVLDAEVCVVPLQVGSGIRLKLLEMFSLKKAIVSTSIGCEGLGVKDGRELLVADTPTTFADGVARVLADSNLRRRLGESGRAFVVDHYGWDKIAERYESTYRDVIHHFHHTSSSASPRQGDQKTV
jgi:glycosyltransferase involved in cell wall biosynthesis